MNLYLAKIIFQGNLDFTLVKADDKIQAKKIVESYYYGYVNVTIKDTLTDICPE